MIVIDMEIKQPVPTEQDNYAATVRFFLEVSRGYLAIRGTAGLALTHQLRSRWGGDTRPGYSPCSQPGAAIHSPPYKSRGEHV